MAELLPSIAGLIFSKAAGAFGKSDISTELKLSELKELRIFCITVRRNNNYCVGILKFSASLWCIQGLNETMLPKNVYLRFCF